MRRALFLTVGLLAGAAVLVVGLADPGLSGRLALGEWGQALAEAVAAAACAAAAVRTGGRERRVWSLFASGLAIWAVTDGLFGLAMVRGRDVGEVSVFDVGWLGFYGPMLAGAALLYVRLRPERGWQGALDGLLLSTAAAALGWTLVIEPAAQDASGGVSGTLVAVLYPALDMSVLMALGWVVLRLRTRAPAWLRLVAAAFALQAIAGLAYVSAAVDEPRMEAVSAAIFMVAAGAWTMAAAGRIGAPERRAWDAGRHDAPPAWSERAPFMLGAAVVGLGALVPDVELRAAAALAAVVMAARAIDALSVRRGLLAERDRLLVTDPLTGAFNRRFLSHEADRAFARARRGEEAVSAVAIDLDGFKAVNDRFGHGAGDELLRRVSDGITAQLRLGDLLCRLGGDEFLVLCPATDAAGALELAERVRRTVGEVSREVVPEVPVTASVGVATFPGDADDPVDLMHRADAALYAGKRAGRDRVVSFAQAGQGEVPC